MRIYAHKIILELNFLRARGAFENLRKGKTNDEKYLKNLTILSIIFVHPNFTVHCSIPQYSIIFQ